MTNDPYATSNTVEKGVTDVKALHINSLYAELKAAAEGISAHPADLAFSYDGDLLDGITITDSGVTDSQYDISGTMNFTYNGSGQITEVETVLTNLGITVTETYTYAGDRLTGVSRTIT